MFYRFVPAQAANHSAAIHRPTLRPVSSFFFLLPIFQLLALLSFVHCIPYSLFILGPLVFLCYTVLQSTRLT